jgi:hypothetical protein
MQHFSALTVKNWIKLQIRFCPRDEPQKYTDVFLGEIKAFTNCGVSRMILYKSSLDNPSESRYNQSKSVKSPFYAYKAKVVLLPYSAG